MLRIRNRRAATLGLVVALILALTVIALAAISLITLLGGGQQMQRATDAGNLSLARSVLVKVSVPIGNSGDEEQLNGITEHTNGGSGVINLRNFNRAMGQSMLVSLNAYKISQDGLDLGAASHAQQLSATVQSLGSRLSTELAKPSSVQDFFSAVAKLNPTKEFGQADISPVGSPKFSYLDRTGASNVFITQQQIPDYDFTNNSSKLFKDKVNGWVTTVSSSSNPNDLYLKGYLEGMTPGNSLPNSYFVPLRPGAKPHLVPQADFDGSATTTANPNGFSWTKPVPNSLSIQAQAKSQQGYLGGFSAYALVEPIDPNGFSAAIPHGFVRFQNGAPSPATGVAAGQQDVFVYVMNSPQFYPKDVNGNPLPYFTSNPNTLNNIINDIKNGKTPDCSNLAVGYALSGDTVGPPGAGKVSPANCANIGAVANPGAPIDNILLDTPGSQGNSDMSRYDNTDNRALWARPVLEKAYNIPPPQGIGSNGQSVNVADSVNLQLLSDRAQGNDFTPQTYQSGIAHVPSGIRAALTSPNFRITSDQGVRLQSTNGEGISKNGPMWNFLTQRMYQIDPNWTKYASSLDDILKQDMVPMGGRAYIYFSPSANGGNGGIVLKNESSALSDAPWLKDFIGQTPDAKSPSNPTEVRQFPLVNDEQIDVSGDWDYPHPYDDEGQICVMNWFSFTPSSGWNNLLGQVNLGAVNTNCCPDGSTNTTSSFSINYSMAGDKITIPAGCSCQQAGGCTYGGPC